MLDRMVEKSGLKHSVQCALGTSMRTILAGAHHAGIDDGSVGNRKIGQPVSNWSRASDLDIA